ncbi:MAG: glycosyltransferase [Clostridia bacterium]|nr:glycosyltransferase [Clostridia bacterium]
MNDRKVSVIVPVYNAEKYLNKAIDSLVGQTLEDIEIILVDDGSIDNSPRICDEYAKKDNRVIVVHKENSGQAIARNVGLEFASRKIYNVSRF